MHALRGRQATDKHAWGQQHEDPCACMVTPACIPLQVTGWWLQNGKEENVNVVQQWFMQAHAFYPPSFFSFFNVFMCITPDYEDATMGTADSCSQWFNPHLKQFMDVNFQTPAPIGAQHWAQLSHYYIKGETGAGSSGLSKRDVTAVRGGRGVVRSE